MHSSLHSPLTRQLSTSSENATPLGAGGQSVPSTQVRTLFVCVSRQLRWFVHMVA